MAKKTSRAAAESWSYVLKDDRVLPLEQQSRFILRPLSQAERATVRDAMNRVVSTSTGELTENRTWQVTHGLALSHIVSIENFPAGAPAPWPNRMSERERYLEQLDDDYVLEIGNEIWVKSTLTPEEGEAAKNSSAPEPTSTSGASSETTARAG